MELLPVTPSIQYTPLPVKTVSQRWLMTKTSYEFKEDQMTFLLSTGSSKQNFNIPYSGINLDNVTMFEERNAWLRNVGVIWILLGIFSVIMQAGSGIFWMGLGTACVAAYFFAVTKYSVIPASDCNILVIRNKAHDGIMQTIRQYRNNFYRKFIRFHSADDPVEGLDRLNWLNEKGIITEEEFLSIRKSLESRIHLPGVGEEEEEDPTFLPPRFH